MPSIKPTYAIAAALLAASGPAAAGQFDYTLYAGVLHSNNVALSDTAPVTGDVLMPGVNFGWNQQGATLKAQAVGDLEYRDYLGGHYRNQLGLELTSQALWTLAPERLDFAVQDYAGVQPLDSLASDAPNNRQQTNVFMAGPILHFRLADTMRGQAELRFINSDAQKTDQFNSNRLQAALRATTDLSPTAELSVNIDAERIHLLKDTVDPDYDRREAYLHYASKLPGFGLDLQGGASRIIFDRAGMRSYISPLLRASATWVVSAQNSLTLSGRRQYSDAVEDLTLQPGTDPLRNDQGISTGNTMVNPQVFTERKAELAWGFHGERLTLSLAPYYRKLDYLGDTSNNQVGRGANASLAYRLSPTLKLQVNASRENLHYDTIDRLNRAGIASIGLVEQRTPHWSWRASLTHKYRHSDTPGQSYDESEIYLGVSYQR